MRLLLVLLIVCTLAACGQKGRLYLPTPDENPSEPQESDE
ncbi:MAG: lipoprotein [Gammaproteobacteria bacterium]|nr:lipoprotein [Gammaproteobacteria bacterium]